MGDHRVATRGDMGGRSPPPGPAGGGASQSLDPRHRASMHARRVTSQGTWRWLAWPCSRRGPALRRFPLGRSVSVAASTGPASCGSAARCIRYNGWTGRWLAHSTLTVGSNVSMPLVLPVRCLLAPALGWGVRGGSPSCRGVPPVSSRPAPRGGGDCPLAAGWYRSAGCSCTWNEDLACREREDWTAPARLGTS